jgi:hypothetical protein
MLAAMLIIGALVVLSSIRSTDQGIILFVALVCLMAVTQILTYELNSRETAGVGYEMIASGR